MAKAWVWDCDLNTHSQLFCLHFYPPYTYCSLTSSKPGSRSEEAESANDLTWPSRGWLNFLLHLQWQRVAKTSTPYQPVHWLADSSGKLWGSWLRSQGGVEGWDPHSLELAFLGQRRTLLCGSQFLWDRLSVQEEVGRRKLDQPPSFWAVRSCTSGENLGNRHPEGHDPNQGKLCDKTAKETTTRW